MWAYTEQLDLATLKNNLKSIVIIKHSNRCSISALALGRVLKRKSEINEFAIVHLIDVVTNRETSLKIAEELGVRHESPQIIVIKEGKVVYTESHMAIRSACKLYATGHVSAVRSIIFLCLASQGS
jgi:bacillithiol system protein YtxJ